jgi:hypothetical protein
MSTQDFTSSNSSPNATPIIPTKKRKEKVLVVVLSLWCGEITLCEVEKYQKVTIKQTVYTVIYFGKRAPRKR